MTSRYKKAGRAAGLLLSFLLLAALGPAGNAAAAPVLRIGSAADLAAFGASVDAGQTYAGLTVTLTGDITMAGRELPAIGWTDGVSYAHVFQGTFDGGGHAIRGLTVSENPAAPAGSSRMGLFSALYNATVRDLELSVTVAAGGQCAVGGLAGLAVNSTLEDVTVNGAVTAAGWSAPDTGRFAAGALLGEAAGRVQLRRCAARGSIGGTGAFTYPVYVGGLVGYVHCAAGGPAGGAIKSCYATADIYVNDRDIYVGGLAGAFRTDGDGGGVPPALADCYAAASIVARGDTVGAFAGYSDCLAQVTNCYYDDTLNGELPGAGPGGKNLAGLAGRDTDTMRAAGFPVVLGDDFTRAEGGENRGYPVFSRPVPSGPEPTEEPTSTPEPTEEPTPAPEPTEEPMPTAEPTAPPEGREKAAPAPAGSGSGGGAAPGGGSKLPKTGDEADVLPWLGLLALCAGALLGLARRRRP